MSKTTETVLIANERMTSVRRVAPEDLEREIAAVVAEGAAQPGETAEECACRRLLSSGTSVTQKNAHVHNAKWVAKKNKQIREFFKRPEPQASAPTITTGVANELPPMSDRYAACDSLGGGVIADLQNPALNIDRPFYRASVAASTRTARGNHVWVLVEFGGEKVAVTPAEAEALGLSEIPVPATPVVAAQIEYLRST